MTESENKEPSDENDDAVGVSAEQGSDDGAVDSEKDAAVTEAGSAETEVAETDAPGSSADVADESVSDEADDDLDELEDDLEDVGGDALEDIADEPEEEVEKEWYILKVQVNRENSICDALNRRVKMHGLENLFGDILVPTEDIKEFTKTGKQRIVKRKLYPGYIVVHMAINDDTWFIVRETPGIGDFTGSAGKPAALGASEIDRILKLSKPEDADEGEVKPRIGFPYKVGDRVRVNEGNFQSLEGDVDAIDESNGRITVILNMFGRATPVQLNHWQVEKI